MGLIKLSAVLSFQAWSFIYCRIQAAAAKRTTLFNLMTQAQQQRIDASIFYLLLIGSVVATCCNYFVKQGFWLPTLTRPGLLFLILFQPFYVWWIYRISKGKRWAKILYLAITGLSLAAYVFDYKRIAAMYLTSPLASINFVYQQLLAFTVAVLLVLTLRKPTPEPVEEEELY